MTDNDKSINTNNYIKGGKTRRTRRNKKIQKLYFYINFLYKNFTLVYYLHF